MNCETCVYQNSKWCGGCQHNKNIAQWPHADNFDFYQEKPKDFDSTEPPSEAAAE